MGSSRVKNCKTMDLQPIFNLVLVAPEIPQNTGNLIRLCANVGARLNLVTPLGFQLNDSKLSRAALDYGDVVDVIVYKSIDEYFDGVTMESVYGAVTSGTVSYTSPKYNLGDTIIFGSESSGLPSSVVEKLISENRIYIPMIPANRSINLANAAAIIVYEMWKQLDFTGAVSKSNLRQPYFS